MVKWRTDTVSRLIRASPARIYAALLHPKALKRWRVPKNMSCDIAHFEAREGGSYEMKLSYRADTRMGKSGAGADVVKGIFVKLVPNSRIEEAVTFQSPDPQFAEPMRLTTILAPTGSATQVVIIAEHVPPAISRADHERGIKDSLDNLAALMAKQQKDGSAG